MSDTEKQVIKVSSILEDLENGLTRPQIAEKYHVTSAEVKMIFEHPKLKGKKAKKVPTFVLEDDTVTSTDLSSDASAEENLQDAGTTQEAQQRLPFDQE